MTAAGGVVAEGSAQSAYGLAGSSQSGIGNKRR